jgi:hypothetical protein
MAEQTLLPDYRPAGGRTPPPRVVELLRETDPNAELIYAGAGRWALGVVRPNRIARQKAERMLETLRELAAVVQLGQVELPKKVRRTIMLRLWTYELYRQGFRPITTYKVQGEPGSWVAEDFRIRDHRYRHQRDEELERREEEWDSEAKEQKEIEALRSYLRLMHKDLHRHAFRRPTHFVPGENARASRRPVIARP